MKNALFFFENAIDVGKSWVICNHKVDAVNDGRVLRRGSRVIMCLNSSINLLANFVRRVTSVYEVLG